MPGIVWLIYILNEGIMYRISHWVYRRPSPYDHKIKIKGPKSLDLVSRSRPWIHPMVQIVASLVLVSFIFIFGLMSLT